MYLIFDTETVFVGMLPRQWKLATLYSNCLANSRCARGVGCSKTIWSSLTALPFPDSEQARDFYCLPQTRCLEDSSQIQWRIHHGICCWTQCFRAISWGQNLPGEERCSGGKSIKNLTVETATLCQLPGDGREAAHPHRTISFLFGGHSTKPTMQLPTWKRLPGFFELLRRDALHPETCNQAEFTRITARTSPFSLVGLNHLNPEQASEKLKRK